MEGVAGVDAGRGDKGGNRETERVEGGVKRAKWMDPRESPKRRLAERAGKEAMVETGKGSNWKRRSCSERRLQASIPQRKRSLPRGDSLCPDREGRRRAASRRKGETGNRRGRGPTSWTEDR